MVIIQFTEETPIPANLKVKTPIRRVTIKGSIVEVEFDGEPDQNELQIIAEKLQKKRIIKNPKKSLAPECVRIIRVNEFA